MEQTKSAILPDLLKVYLTGMYFGHGLPPQEKRHTRLPSLSRRLLESTGKHRNLTLQIFATDLDTDAIEKARRGFSLILL
jgi:two-component system CheB/CheR fusion protein